MAMFGSKAGAYNPSSLSGSDKLMLFSAMLRDLGSGQGPETILGTQQMLAGRQEQARKQAMQRELAGIFGGGVPMGAGQPPPTVPRGPIGPDSGMAPPPAMPPRPPQQMPQMGRAPGGLPSLRDVGPKLGALAAQGMDIGDIVGLLDKAGPQVRYERGMRYDERDLNSAPDFIPDLDKGEYADRTDGGLRIRNIAGAVESAAERAGAVTGAQEGAKSAFDLVDVPLADGSTRKMTRFQAAQMLSGQGGQLPPGFGATQTPAARTYAEGASKEQVERDFTRPKAEAALAAMDAKTRVVDDAIERAIQGVGGWTAGPGAMLSAIPGSPAKDLQANLETIKANLGFDELQTMRDNSPTGGALGQVAVQELEALRSTLSSLDQAQSPDQLRSSLERVRQIRQGSAQRRREAFARTYGGQGGGSQGRNPPPAPPSGQRQRGSVYNTPRGPMTWTGTGWLPAN